MSWMLDRRLSFLFMLFSRMKYFCAWLATCDGSHRRGTHGLAVTDNQLITHEAGRTGRCAAQASVAVLDNKTTQMSYQRISAAAERCCRERSCDRVARSAAWVHALKHVLRVER